MSYRLAAVYAHPDDDTYGVGGTLALRPDVSYTLIAATSGDAGMISDPSLATTENLGQVREQEERDSLAALGVKDPDIRFLRYPDMHLSEVPRQELVQRVAELLGEAKPDVMVTFGPEGITRHPDHVTIGQVATEAFHRARDSAGTGFRRLYYNAVAQSDIDRLWEFVRQSGLDMGNPDDPFMPQGVPDETIAVRVDCQSVVERKMEAVRAHRTQANEIQAFPEELFRAFLSFEYFVQAWPPPGELRGATAASLFDGLV